MKYSKVVFEEFENKYNKYCKLILISNEEDSYIYIPIYTYTYTYEFYFIKNKVEDLTLKFKH